jgi:hypothetical protein
MTNAASKDIPEPIRGDRGAAILGPRNVPLERENPDLLASPYTDSGTIPNLKFSFATARNRLLTGGWAREVTVRELPVATELAGVRFMDVSLNEWMALTPPELVQAHLNLDRQTMAALRKDKPIIVK